MSAESHLRIPLKVGTILKLSNPIKKKTLIKRTSYRLVINSANLGWLNLCASLIFLNFNPIDVGMSESVPHYPLLRGV